MNLPQWNLPKYYASIIQITEWRLPAAADWCKHLRLAQSAANGRLRLTLQNLRGDRGCPLAGVLPTYDLPPLPS